MNTKDKPADKKLVSGAMTAPQHKDYVGKTPAEIMKMLMNGK